MPEANNPMTPNQPVPAATLQLTPNGTPVIPGQSIPPELVALFKVALETLPPNAFSQFLKQNWKWVLTTITSLLLPLLLTTYNAVQDMLAGPAQITALATVVDNDRKEVEALKGQVKELDEKLDRLLWLMQTSNGASTGTTNRN